MTQGFIRRRPAGAGHTNGAPRASSGGKPKIYMGMHKQPYPRPPYNTDPTVRCDREAWMRIAGGWYRETERLVIGHL